MRIFVLFAIHTWESKQGPCNMASAARLGMSRWVTQPVLRGQRNTQSGLPRQGDMKLKGQGAVGSGQHLGRRCDACAGPTATARRRQARRRPPRRAAAPRPRSATRPCSTGCRKECMAVSNASFDKFVFKYLCYLVIL